MLVALLVCHLHHRTNSFMVRRSIASRELKTKLVCVKTCEFLDECSGHDKMKRILILGLDCVGNGMLKAANKGPGTKSEQF